MRFFAAVILVFSITTVCKGTLSPEEHLTFYASFDSSFSPDYFNGLNDIRRSGNPEIIKGLKGNAIKVDAMNYIKFCMDKNLSLEKGSLSLWVSPLDWTPSERYPHVFLSSDDDSGFDQWIVLYKFWSKPDLLYLTGSRTGGPAQSIKSSIRNWETGSWHHIAVSWDYSQNAETGIVKLYIDGKLCRTLSETRKPENTGRYFIVGGNILNFPATSGHTAIDELKIFNKILDQNDISKLLIINKVKKEPLLSFSEKGKLVFSKVFQIEKTGAYCVSGEIESSDEVFSDIRYNIDFYDVNGNKTTDTNQGLLSVSDLNFGININIPDNTVSCAVKLEAEKNKKVLFIKMKEIQAAYPVKIPKVSIRHEWDAAWIGSEKNAPDKKLSFIKTFKISDEEQENAKVQINANCQYEIFVNDLPITVSYGIKNTEETSETYDIKKELKSGVNSLRICLLPSGGKRYLAAQLRATDKSGTETAVNTDATWICEGYSDKGNYGVRTFPERKFQGTSFISSFKACPVPKEPVISAGIRKENGKVSVFVNGKLFDLTHFHLLHFNPEEITRIRDSGIHTYILAFFPENGMLGWHGPEKYNYSIAEQFIKAVISIDPNAKIIPCVWLSALNVKWWADSNPEELCRDEKNNVVLCNRLNGKIKGESLGSDKWLEESGNALRNLVKNLEGGPLSKYIIGYYITLFFTRECQYWGMGERDYTVDFSLPMKKQFRKWISENIKNAPPREIRIPGLSERLASGYGNLCDPEKDRLSICYYDFLSDRMAYFLNTYGRIVKEETNWKKLTGTLYGYAVSLDHDQLWPRERAHLGIKKVLDSPYIDLLGSPSEYDNRGIGESGGFSSVPESINLHGKLFVNQEDLRTYVQRISSRDNEDLNDLSSENLQDSLSVIKREFIMTLVHHTPIQWYEFTNRWLTGDIRIMNLLKTCKKISSFCAGFNYDIPQEDSIAWIINERSALYGTEKKIRSPYENLFRTGIPVKSYLLSDITDYPELLRHKIFIFSNCYYMTEKEFNFICDKLQRDGKILFWPGIPPLLIDGKLSLYSASKITGLKLESSFLNESVDVKGVDDCHFENTNIKMAPVFFVQDKDAETIAVQKASGKTGIAIRKFHDWTSVYSIVNEISPDLVRKTVRGKIHVYSTADEPIYISSKFLGLHSLQGGKFQIALPGKATVYDVFSNKIISKDTDLFEVNIPKSGTLLLFYGSPEFIADCQRTIWE